MATEPELRPPPPQVLARAEDLRSRIDTAELRRELTALPGPRNRVRQPAAADRTVAMLASAFQDAGWHVTRQTFELREAALSAGSLLWRVGHRVLPDVPGTNVVATKPGRSPTDLVVVGAHHDTLPRTPGADDNGAGLVALTELARLLAPCEFRDTIVLAAFDFEELGFHGARTFLKQLSSEQRIRGALVYETMAYTSREPGSQAIPKGLGALFPRQLREIRARRQVGDWNAVIYRKSAQTLAMRFAGVLAALEGSGTAMLVRDPVDLPVAGRALKLLPAVRHLARSDHIPFWEAGWPAIQITDTANFRNPNYHRSTDTPDTIDYERLAAIIAASVVTLEATAGLERRSPSPPPSASPRG